MRSDSPDPYRSVILVLLAAAAAGALAAAAGGLALGAPALLDVALSLGLAAGILLGVAQAQTLRSLREPMAPVHAPASSPEGRFVGRIDHWYRRLAATGKFRFTTALLGGIAIGLLLSVQQPSSELSLQRAAMATASCLLAAGLAATAARYLGRLDPAALPEAPGLARGARVLAWILVLGGGSIGLTWAGRPALAHLVRLLALFVDGSVCLGLIARLRRDETPPGPAEHPLRATFPLDLAVLNLLGSRPNVLASVLDAAERQLGIDLRSTWALTVVRRSVEPLAAGLLLLGWLSTSLTVLRVGEEGLVERLGVPSVRPSLQPGLHLHWPWPVDRVLRLPMQRVQAVTVGHEEQEEDEDETGGGEDVLWARQHAANEYTLLLGNGRDLITVDAAVQFRIRDPRAWQYGCQNPADALRAIAYRAVMRSTVNRTLAGALSENVVRLTERMRAMVQGDADALDLGVEVVAFTVGGMHPPVMVAPDYQAVASAELRKVTAVVNAQAFRNQTVPTAEAAVVRNVSLAHASGAQTLARAAGEAWAFRALESQVRAAPAEYYFRRRLETLETDLEKRRFVVLDSRIQRDGGELWLTQ